MIRENLHEMTEEAKLKNDLPEELEQQLLNRCKKAAGKGRDFIVVCIWEMFNGEYIGKSNIEKFAQKHNLTYIEAPPTGTRGTAYKLSW